jgi:hypothetical protein
MRLAKLEQEQLKLERQTKEKQTAAVSPTHEAFEFENERDEIELAIKDYYSRVGFQHDRSQSNSNKAVTFLSFDDVAMDRIEGRQIFVNATYMIEETAGYSITILVQRTSAFELRRSGTRHKIVTMTTEMARLDGGT